MDLCHRPPIPPGRVASYGQIAEITSASSARTCSARLVGYAMAALRSGDHPDVPWQRVINRQGKISITDPAGGYMQRKLLIRGRLFVSTEKMGKLLPHHGGCAMAVIQEKREVSGFDEIHLEGSGTLLLQQGDQDLLIIETEEDILPKIKSEVRDGRLSLGFKNWLDHILQIGSPPITYHITMRQVHGVSISGTGKLTAGQIRTDHLNLKISGSGELNLASCKPGTWKLLFPDPAKPN